MLRLLNTFLLVSCAYNVTQVPRNICTHVRRRPNPYRKGSPTIAAQDKIDKTLFQFYSTYTRKLMILNIDLI